MKKFLFIFFLFLFNIKSINTMDSKVLIYDKLKPYVESEYDINFYSLNVKDMENVFKDLDIEILSVKPVNELYYNKELKIRGYNLTEIMDNLAMDYSKIVKLLGYDEASLYYEINGFNIEKIRVRCLAKELIKLENRIDII